MKTLNDVVAGDTVIKSNRYHTHICKVIRVTDSQVVIHFGKNATTQEPLEEKFRKKNGRLVGESDSWSYTSIRIPEDGECDRILAQRKCAGLKSYLKQYPWDMIQNIELLEQIKALLPIQEKD